MHPNQIFRGTPADRNADFARERAFGVLSVNGSDGPLLAHIPFLLSADAKIAHLHLVRSNPIARACTQPQPCVIAVSGPDSYISPDWYGVPDQVPTWNYVAVHLRGTLRLMEPDELHPMLDRQSAHFEDQLLPKTPWTTSKMTDGVMDRMMRAIVPCEMVVTDIDGTWKLSQNKPDVVRHAAAENVVEDGMGSEVAAIGTLMRDVPDAKDN